MLLAGAVLLKVDDTAAGHTANLYRQASGRVHAVLFCFLVAVGHWTKAQRSNRGIRDLSISFKGLALDSVAEVLLLQKRLEVSMHGCSVAPSVSSGVAAAAAVQKVLMPGLPQLRYIAPALQSRSEAGIWGESPKRGGAYRALKLM